MRRHLYTDKVDTMKKTREDWHPQRKLGKAGDAVALGCVSWEKPLLFHTSTVLKCRGANDGPLEFYHQSDFPLGKS